MANPIVWDQNGPFQTFNYPAGVFFLQYGNWFDDNLNNVAAPTQPNTQFFGGGGSGSAITGATATGLAAGSQPTASISGGTLALGIPAGQTGPGVNSATASALAAGANPTASLNSGVLSLGIPAGNNGTAATISVTPAITMVPAGNSASVANTGTSSAANLQFTIPYPATSNLTMLQSAVGWTTSNTVTTAQTATSVVIPANTMTANSQMEIIVEYSITGGTTTKTLAIVDNASGFVIATNGGAFASSGYYGQLVKMSNRNATNVQFIRSTSITTPYGTGGANGVAGNIGSLDFTVSRTINFANTFSATGGTESIKVEAYQIRIWTP